MENDIRVERTINSLRCAFVKLLDEVPAYSISVTSLTRNAKVSRVTFYIHYSDMTDFIDKFCDHVMKSITWPFGKELNLFNIDNARLIFHKQINAVKENAHILRALLSENGPEHFWDEFMNMISNEYRENIYKHKKDRYIDEEEMTFLTQYISSGELQMITEWIKKDSIEPTEKMVERIINYTYKGVFTFLGIMDGN